MKIVFFLCFTLSYTFSFGQSSPLNFDTLQQNIATNLFQDVLLARSFAKEYKESAYAINDTFYMAKGQNFIGMTHYMEGNNVTALEYYLESLPLFESLNDTFFIAMLNNNIGAAYGERQEPESAIGFYEIALEKFELLKDTLWIANVLNNLGVQYNQQGEYEKNVDLGRKARPLYEAIKDTLSLSYLIANQAVTGYKMHDFEKAERLAMEYINDYKKFYDPMSLSIAYFAMGKVEENRRNYKKAKEYALKSLDIRKEKKLKNHIDNSYLQLSSIAESADNYKEALEYYKNYKIYEDSTWTRNKDKNINELITQYKVKEKDAEIHNLNTEKELESLKVKGLRNQRLLYIIGLASLMLLVGGLLYFLYHRNKKNALLREKNQVIENSLAEKETLLKEIHHRVKNNLQVVSSLLSLQSRSVKNKAAVDALEEGQSRVNSMALIHQHLYKDNQDVTSVNMKEYTENLCRSVLAVHKLTQKDVELDIQVVDIQLDISTVVPLGLIMNELVTNSCKYAFRESQDGKLSINLQEKEGKLYLRVKDNGHQEYTSQGDGFGNRMIRAFAQKLEAEIEVNTDDGYETELIIGNYEK